MQIFCLRPKRAVNFGQPEYSKEALERVCRIGRYGADGWDYIKRKYETLFGEKNQVK
jgi:hypothetical protein